MGLTNRGCNRDPTGINNKSTVEFDPRLAGNPALPSLVAQTYSHPLSCFTFSSVRTNETEPT